MTVEDFETGLTNNDHFREILKERDFKYSAMGPSGFNSPVTMSNPLYPDLKTKNSEEWILSNSQNQADVVIDIFEWEPDHAPQPDIIKSIRIMVNRNSEYAGQMIDFLEKVKNKYPDKSKRYFRNNDLFEQFGDPMNVFTNGSRIEVRTDPADPMYSHFYRINFDLF
jgi:hypothetical protein